MTRARTFEYKGEELTIAELVKLSPHKMSKQTLRNRLLNGMRVEDALTKPTRQSDDWSAMPCGAKSPYDCLNCKFKYMPCLSYPAMSGEGAGDFADADYKKRSEE